MLAGGTREHSVTRASTSGGQSWQEVPTTLMQTQHRQSSEVVVVVTAAFYYLLGTCYTVTVLLLMPSRKLSKLRGQVPCQPPTSEIPRFGAL